MKKLETLFIVLTIILFISSCDSKEESAKKSLIGLWQVTEVYRYNPSEGINREDLSGIGTFQFSAMQCDYSYSFDSENISQVFEYKFESSRENAGFTKIDVFEIVGEEEVYRVRFGDQTSDSYKNASEISLERTVDLDTIQFDLLIELEKI